MEVVKKITKSKKRRHSGKDVKKKVSLSKEKSLCEVKSEIVKPVKSKKHQLIQTDTLNIQEDNLKSKELIKEKDEQIKSLSEKIQNLTCKFYETKNAYTALKQEFNKAQKLLCSEVGENVTVASLSNQPGGWRGRAEQIHQLQQKISDMQQKLIENEGVKKKSIERSLSNIRSIDREKKQIESLTKQLKETELALENTKKKFESAKSRISVFENDLNVNRRTLCLMNEKTNHDNQLIEAMHEQLKNSEADFKDKELCLRKQNERFDREISNLKSQLQIAQTDVEHYKYLIDEKDIELENKKEESTIVNSCETSKGNNKNTNEYVAYAKSAEAQKNGLLELVGLLNERLDKAREENEEINDSYKKERLRAVKLENNLQKLESERSNIASSNSRGSSLHKTSKSNTTSNNNLNEQEEFRLKYELLQEECSALKIRLATVQKDKNADLATFKSMLDQTKKIYQESKKVREPKN